jgi:hypothetical protein
VETVHKGQHQAVKHVPREADRDVLLKRNQRGKSKNGQFREAGNLWAHKAHSEDKQSKTHTHTQHRKLKRLATLAQ